MNKRLAIPVILAFLLGGIGLAKSEKGSVSGRVIDEAEDKPLPGVTVRIYVGEAKSVGDLELLEQLKDKKTLTSREKARRGEFEIKCLASGTYTLTFELLNYIEKPLLRVVKVGDEGHRVRPDAELLHKERDQKYYGKLAAKMVRNAKSGGRALSEAWVALTRKGASPRIKAYTAYALADLDRILTRLNPEIAEYSKSKIEEVVALQKACIAAASRKDREAWTAAVKNSLESEKLSRYIISDTIAWTAGTATEDPQWTKEAVGRIYEETPEKFQADLQERLKSYAPDLSGGR